MMLSSLKVVSEERRISEMSVDRVLRWTCIAKNVTSVCGDIWLKNKVKLHYHNVLTNLLY